MAKNTIMTIGYEGATIDDFVATLLLAKVETLIDIRDVPVSRKAGFSKLVLGKRLLSEGIFYCYLGALGDPKEGREAARRGDKENFERVFYRHMETEPAQQALENAIEIAQKSRSCLLCFEKKAEMCHRLIVAKAMALRMETTIQNIGVRSGIAERIDDKEFIRRYAVA